MSTLASNAYICTRCLRRLPQFSLKHDSRKSLTSLPSPPPDSGFAKLNSRRLISLSGQDAPKYLQGLIAANISTSSIRSPQSLYTVFLNAQGRVLYDVFIYPWEDEAFLIEVDANEVDSLYKHLKRYKLRAKVGLRVVDDGEMNVWSIWGQSQAYAPGAFKDSRIPEQGSRPNMGSRSIMLGNGRPEVEANEVESVGYDVRRIQLGVPEGQREVVKESALPQESNVDYMHGVDFRKGCYVGQELTIRTHHTGVVRKRILPVQLYLPSEQRPSSVAYDGSSKFQLPPPGSNISRVGRKGRSAGKWLGGVGNVGLALCRLEVMTDTVLTSEGSQYNATDEFQIAWEDGDGAEPKELRVKAFVPWWHAVRAAEQTVQRPNG